MQTFQFRLLTQFLLLTHLLEAPVLLREVTRGAFFRWLPWEHAVVTVIAHYLCQPIRLSFSSVQQQTQCKTVLTQSAW